MGGFSIVWSTRKYQKAKNRFFEKIREIKPLKKTFRFAVYCQIERLVIFGHICWNIDSNRSEKYFSLALTQNPWRNLILGGLCTVFPLKMRCISRNWPCIVIANVTGTKRLSELLPTVTWQFLNHSNRLITNRKMF